MTKHENMATNKLATKTRQQPQKPEKEIAKKQTDRKEPEKGNPERKKLTKRLPQNSQR